MMMFFVFFFFFVVVCCWLALVCLLFAYAYTSAVVGVEEESIL